MERLTTPRPSPAILVATLALVAALAGTALADTDATTSAINKQKVKKIAPDLSVRNAAALGGKPPSAFAPSAAEAVHRIGASGEPQFQNDWGNSAPQLRAAGFYKDPFGVVHLEGAIDGGLSSEPAFTLPPGYRPSKLLLLSAHCGSPPSAVQVTPNGVVAPGCNDSTVFTMFLDGVTFRVP